MLFKYLAKLVFLNNLNIKHKYKMAVMCLICNRMFSNQTNVNKHMKNIHNKHSKAVEYEASIGTYKCLEGCETSFKFNNDLRDHLRIKHGLSQDVVTKSFTSYNDFMSWLKIEEAQNNVRYFRGTGRKKLGGGSLHANSKIYFDCARSGKLSKGVISSSKGKKTQGSCKLNRYCTSQIIVTVKEDSCVMKYFKNHYGHIHELQHIRLSKQKREVTAAKLILGISSECILDSTRDNIGKNLNRDDLLTNKDINNIKQSFNIQLRSSGYRHKDDPISVDLWIEEVKESKYNHVLYYKKQNHSCQRYNLSPQDFILILMTKTQRDLMKKFGTTVICVDTTHGLNAYNFELTTILTIDEYGNGFPCAFMFTNRMDSYAQHIFYTEVRNSVGEIKTDVFMSDITSVFYTPWQQVMGPANKNLYCSWHIDRVWQTNLNKIADKDTKQWVYKSLKYLQTIMQEHKFQKEFAKFMHLLESDSITQNFALYLRKYYSTNTQQWAYCFRKQCLINTNMHLESMHKTIKYVYLKGKKIKRLDKTLHALQRFVRDKTIERIMKVTKNANHSHINSIRSRHRSALLLNSSQINITKCSDENNYIYNVIVKEDNYIVTKKQSSPCCNLKCSYCDICIHSYECTCVDYNLKLTICKHVHVLCLQKSTQSKEMPSVEDYKNKEIEQLVEGLQTMKQETNSIKTTKLEEDVISMAHQIIHKVKTNKMDADNLELIKKNLKVAVSVGSINCSLANLFVDKCGNLPENTPANKKIEKQSYFSTKKARKNESCNLKKPTLQEVNIIRGTINNELFICTDKRHDHMY